MRPAPTPSPPREYREVKVNRQPGAMDLAKHGRAAFKPEEQEDSRLATCVFRGGVIVSEELPEPLVRVRVIPLDRVPKIFTSFGVSCG